MVNPFDVFRKDLEKTAKIDGLEGEIKYRELTMGEADSFNKRLLKNYNGKGDPTVDMNEATKIGYEKLELCMLEPKMTVKQLQKLPTSAGKAINAIIKLIDGIDDAIIDDEGNSKD